jgi:hypothetical protein
LPQDVIDIVYEYFGPGTVIFDFDRLVLMPKICKIEMPHWLEFLNDENTVVAKLNIMWFTLNGHQVIRTIKLACDDWNNTLCELDYAAVTYPGDHALKLKYSFNGALQNSETHLVFPKRSHNTVLKYIFPMFGTLPKEWWLNFNGLEDSY